MALFEKNSTQRGCIKIPLSLMVGISLISSLANPIIARAGDGVGEVINSEDNSNPVILEDIEPVREAKKSFTVVATAYSSEAAQTDSTPCIPAMWRFNLCDYYNKTGVEDTVAINFLPLGAEVRFPDLYGNKIFIVRDRMNSRYNGKKRIDFWKKDRESAVVFGVKRIAMDVL